MQVQVLDGSTIEVKEQPFGNLNDVILGKLGITKAEYKLKYSTMATNPRQTFISDKGEAYIRIQVLFFSRNPKEGVIRKEIVDVHPTEVNMAKECEILVAVQEDDVINLETRKTETGWFVFPVKVKIPSILEWKHRWLYTYKNQIFMSRLLSRAINDNSGIFTNRISPTMIRDRQFSNYHKTFPKRKRISLIQLQELLRKGQLYYVFSSEGNILIGYLAK